MKKKTFRPNKSASPNYPVLREIDHHAMSGWGIAALGGLLLGGACTPAHADKPRPGGPPAVRVEKKPEGKEVSQPDKKADQPKADPKNPSGAEGTAATNNAADEPVKHDKPRMMGKMRMPRPEEGVQEESGSASPPKAPPASERRRDAGTSMPAPPPRRAGVARPQRLDPPAKAPSKTDDTKKDASAKSTKNSSHDGVSKDTTSTPPKTRTERTP